MLNHCTENMTISFIQKIGILAHSMLTTDGNININIVF